MPKVKTDVSKLNPAREVYFLNRPFGYLVTKGECAKDSISFLNQHYNILVVSKLEQLITWMCLVKPALQATQDKCLLYLLDETKPVLLLCSDAYDIDGLYNVNSRPSSSQLEGYDFPPSPSSSEEGGDRVYILRCGKLKRDGQKLHTYSHQKADLIMSTLSALADQSPEQLFKKVERSDWAVLLDSFPQDQSKIKDLAACPIIDRGPFKDMFHRMQSENLFIPVDQRTYTPFTITKEQVSKSVARIMSAFGDYYANNTVKNPRRDCLACASLAPEPSDSLE